MQRGEVALEEKRDGARVLLEVRERDEEDVMHDVPVAGSGHRHCFFFLFLFFGYCCWLCRHSYFVELFLFFAWEFLVC